MRRAGRWLAVVWMVCAGAAFAKGKHPAKRQAAPASLLRAEKADYVGTWLASGEVLTIHPDGKVDYERKRGAVSKSLSGVSIVRFEGNDFTVGTSLMSTKFVVSHPPAQVAGRWTMTVDGVELIRNPTPQDSTDSTVNVGCNPGPGGFTCVVQHTGGVHTLKACYQLQLSCMNGTQSAVDACETVKIGGSASRMLPFNGFPGLDRCDRPKGQQVVLKSLTGAD